MRINVKLSSFIDFIYRNMCEHTTTYVWCNDDGELFGDNEYYDGCCRICFADYSSAFDDTGSEIHTDDEDMTKKLLANMLAESYGYPKIGETDDGENIELINL